MSNCSYFGGIDLAKNHCSIHVIDSDGKVIFQKFVTRPKLLTNIANMLPMRIVSEVCGGVHFLKEWIQEQQGLFDKSLVPQRRSVGCGETAIREPLYVFVLSHAQWPKWQNEVDDFVVRDGSAAIAANRILLPIDRRKAHTCYICATLPNFSSRRLLVSSWWTLSNFSK